MIQRPVLFLAPLVAILSLMLVLTLQDSATAATPAAVVATPAAVVAAPTLTAQPAAIVRTPLRIESETFAQAPLPTPPAAVTMVPSFITATPVPATKQPTVATSPPSNVASMGSSRLSVPALGINGNWSDHGCATPSLPGGLFRWICAGVNNTYLVSHNTSTFAPLRQAYLAGWLRPGMVAYFSDAAGRTSVWRLAWATDMEKTREVYTRWAEVGGPSATPVITMQTCLDGGANGAASTRFIITKWVPVG